MTCRVLGIARQPFYRWLADPVAEAEWIEAHRVNALIDAHARDVTSGYRMLADDVREQGWAMADRTAWRLCHREGLRSTPPSHPEYGAHDNVAPYALTASQPNELWLAALSEHRLPTGKHYLCTLKDVHTGVIVGYATSARKNAALAVEAVENAAARCGDAAGCIVSSDRGSQFRSRRFLRTLSRLGLVESLGRVDTAEDYAEKTAFFAELRRRGAV